MVAYSAFNPEVVTGCILLNPKGVAGCSYGWSAAQPVEAVMKQHPAPAGAADSPAPAGAARIECLASTGCARESAGSTRGYTPRPRWGLNTPKANPQNPLRKSLPLRALSDPPQCTPLAASHRSASSAATHPIPAADTACR